MKGWTEDSNWLFCSLLWVWWCVCLGPLKSRNKHRIKYSRNKSEEVLVQDNGQDPGRAWKNWQTMVQVWLSLKERRTDRRKERRKEVDKTGWVEEVKSDRSNLDQCAVLMKVRYRHWSVPEPKPPWEECSAPQEWENGENSFTVTALMDFKA